MELNFSFKTVKEEKPEKYPNLPVLTFVEKSGVTKFSLNKKAFELLKFSETETNKINFGLADGKELFLANTNGTVEQNISNLNKDKSLNNNKLYERLENHFGISIEPNAEFLLLEPETEQKFPILLISNSDPSSYIVDEFSEIEDNEFEDSIKEADQGVIESVEIIEATEQEIN